MTDLHYEVHDGNGPRLLLVHGFFSSRANWLPNLPALCRVATPVVVELWGHGRSPSPTDPACYTAEAYVAAFERLREELACERWFVCGHSLGAALTLRYALDHPDRVIGHIMMNSSSAVADEAWFAGAATMFEETATALETGGPEVIRTHRLFPGRVRTLPDDVRRAFEDDVELHDGRGLAATIRYTNPTTSSRHRVGDNAVPTLLVVGEREAGFEPLRRFLEEAMPHLTVVATPAGHPVNLEAAEAFEQATAAFLGSYMK